MAPEIPARKTKEDATPPSHAFIALKAMEAFFEIF